MARAAPLAAGLETAGSPTPVRQVTSSRARSRLNRPETARIRPADAIDGYTPARTVWMDIQPVRHHGGAVREHCYRDTRGRTRSTGQGLRRRDGAAVGTRSHRGARPHRGEWRVPQRLERRRRALRRHRCRPCSATRVPGWSKRSAPLSPGCLSATRSCSRGCRPAASAPACMRGELSLCANSMTEMGRGCPAERRDPARRGIPRPCTTTRTCPPSPAMPSSTSVPASCCPAMPISRLPASSVVQ